MTLIKTGQFTASAQGLQGFFGMTLMKKTGQFTTSAQGLQGFFYEHVPAISHHQSTDRIAISVPVASIFYVSFSLIESHYFLSSEVSQARGPIYYKKVQCTYEKVPVQLERERKKNYDQ